MSKARRPPRFAAPFLALLLALAPVSALAGGPPPRRARRPPRVKIVRKTLLFRGPASCLERTFLVNTDRSRTVLVRVVEIQHLFSGPLEQTYLAWLEPGERLPFRCTRWPGSAGSSELRIVALSILDPVPFGQGVVSGTPRARQQRPSLPR